MTVSTPESRRKSVLEIVGLTASAIALIGFVGTAWLIMHLAVRPGGLGNLGDATIASLAVPVALAGIAGIAFITFNGGIAGLAYTRFVRREVFVRGSPLLGPTRTQFIVFIEIALLWAALTANLVTKLGLNAVGLLLLCAIPAVTAFALESLWLCNSLWPTTKWARKTVFAAASGAAFATLAFALPTYGAYIFSTIATTAQPKAFLPREGWFAVFLLIALVTNYVTSLAGKVRFAFVAVYSIGTLVLLAPSAISDMPFRVLGLVDFDAQLVPADARTEAFRKVHAQCGTSPALRSDSMLVVHVRSSVGSDYIVDCTLRGWTRIPKSQVAAELAPTKVIPSAAPAHRP